MISLNSHTGNFESNPPSTVNTAKFDCLDLSGPPCRLLNLNNLESLGPKEWENHIAHMPVLALNVL